jgi:mannose-1-phosphate guanylyltransferase
MSTNQNLYAVILAGGSGTRFWPLSRQANPKQFLKMMAERSLLQETLTRISSRVKSSNILIVTNKGHRGKILQQVKAFKIPKHNILLEPAGKNTAPAIAWAAAHIARHNKDAVMMVLPSDHLILNANAFVRYLDETVQLAEQNYLVTLGIVPTRPETGYGYLRVKSFQRLSKTVWKVEKFTEKPSLETAKRFIQTRNYLWNSGMFVWKVSVIIDAFEKHLPEISRAFSNYKGAVHKFWSRLPSISIDYGILEKSGNVATVPAKDMGWSDLGSWESLAEVRPKDKDGNTSRGSVIQLHCNNSLIFADHRLVAAVGLKDLIVVDTPDALLICRKDQSQHVRNVVESLKKNKQHKLL